jgi:peptide deformylase
MSALRIRIYPAAVLRKKASEVKEIDGRLQALMDDMVETMRYANGAGLAAPQVGVSRRVIVADPSKKEGDSIPIILINPVIVYSEGEVESREGCLSIPDLFVPVVRAAKVFVKGLDRDGNTVEVEAGGLLARVFQHEVDHLNGVCLVERMGFADREFFTQHYMKDSKTAAG